MHLQEGNKKKGKKCLNTVYLNLDIRKGLCVNKIKAKVGTETGNKQSERERKTNKSTERT